MTPLPSPRALKGKLKPLFFSPATAPVRHGCGRLVSGLGLGSDEQAALRAIFRRIPGEPGQVLRERQGWFLDALRNGCGMSPWSQWKLLRRLSGGVAPRRARRRAVARPARYDGRRLRLLFVPAIFPSVRHGGGLWLFDLMRALSARHEVRLYSPYRPDTERQSWERLAPSLGPSRLLVGDALEDRDLTSWLSATGTDRFDAVHLVWPHVTPVLGEARRLTDRLVFEIVECITRRAAIECVRAAGAEDRDKAGPALFSLVEAFEQERVILESVDRAFALTPADAEFAHQVFGGELPEVMPTGVSDYAVREPARLLPDPGRGLDLPPSAVFIGFYGHPPNVEGMAWYLRHIHPEVIRRVPGFRVRIAGIGDTEPLRRLAGRDPSVEFVGEVESVVPTFRASRVCLAPLISGGGIRTKMHQYAAAGRPCVATSMGVCGTPYVDGESVLVADEPAAFARNVVRLLTDDALYARIRDNAWKIVEEGFTWDGLLPVFEELYGG